MGDLLLTPHGELRVDDLFREETTAQVFNLQIANVHTYTVGNAAILVHNTSAAPTKAPLPKPAGGTGRQKPKTCADLACATEEEICEFLVSAMNLVVNGLGPKGKPWIRTVAVGYDGSRCRFSVSCNSGEDDEGCAENISTAEALVGPMKVTYTGLIKLDGETRWHAEPQLIKDMGQSMTHIAISNSPCKEKAEKGPRDPNIACTNHLKQLPNLVICTEK